MHYTTRVATRLHWKMFRLHIQVRSIDCADQIPPKELVAAEELVAAITQHWDTGSVMEEYFTLRMSYIFI